MVSINSKNQRSSLYWAQQRERQYGVRSRDDLTLRLDVPGQEYLIVVEKAAVRWIAGKTFGFEFVSLQSVERQRLRELLRWVA